MKTIKTNKPREVFAWYEHGGTCFDCDFDVLKKEGTVSFVEKSAYDELQKKLEIAVKTFKNIKINLQDHVDSDKENRCSYYSIEDALHCVLETLNQIEETKDEND